MFRLFFFTAFIILAMGGTTASLAKKSVTKNLPPISGMDLTGMPRKVPRSLDNNLSVIIFAFQEEQQEIVNQWLPFVRALQRNNDDLEFYEVIVYNIANPDAKYWSNEAIRKGILQKDDSDHTITIFLDNKKFLKNMKMQEDNIYTMLIKNRSGKILWRGEGEPTASEQEALQQAINIKRRE